MTDQIKDAVIALQQGDSATFKDAVSASLMDKAMDAIAVERMMAGQKFFNEPEEDYDEEV